MVGYAKSIEVKMVRLYESLNEKDRRRYAAIEAEKLGHGGTEYIAHLFNCDPKTIRRGLKEVEILPQDEASQRVRKKGAGAKLLAKHNRGLSKRSAKRSKTTPPARL